LRAISPCIDAARCVGVFMALDGEGNVRPQGDSPDMGADEWSPHLYHLDPPTGTTDLDLRVAGLMPADRVTI
jgi:hypothetical protein